MKVKRYLEFIKEEFISKEKESAKNRGENLVTLSLYLPGSEECEQEPVGPHPLGLVQLGPPHTLETIMVHSYKNNLKFFLVIMYRGCSFNKLLLCDQ